LARKRKFNVTNPFQAVVPSCDLPQNNRRERFKKVFFAVLAAHILLFLTLLIQGCRGGQNTKTSSMPADFGTITAQY